VAAVVAAQALDWPLDGPWLDRPAAIYRVMAGIDRQGAEVADASFRSQVGPTLAALSERLAVTLFIGEPRDDTLTVLTTTPVDGR
jgi:hypothetical protein